MHDLFFNSRISYILQVIPVTMLVGLCYIAVHRRRTDWAKCLFTCYLTALAGIVLVPANFWSKIFYPIFYGMDSGNTLEFFHFSYNLEPTVFKYLTGEYTGGSWVVFMFLANGLLFVPYGILHPLARPGRSTLKEGIATILAVELLQPIVGRSFDTDDLICNTLGLLIGCGIWGIVSGLIRSANRH